MTAGPSARLRAARFAFVTAALAHLSALAALLFSLIAGAPAQESDAGEVVTETKVEEQKPEPDLTNTDLGIDDTMQTNYNVDRIEDVSVPGPVDPTSPVGVPGAPEDAVRWVDGVQARHCHGLDMLWYGLTAALPLPPPLRWEGDRQFVGWLTPISPRTHSVSRTPPAPPPRGAS